MTDFEHLTIATWALLVPLGLAGLSWPRATRACILGTLVVSPLVFAVLLASIAALATSVFALRDGGAHNDMAIVFVAIAALGGPALFASNSILTFVCSERGGRMLRIAALSTAALTGVAVALTTVKAARHPDPVRYARSLTEVSLGDATPPRLAIIPRDCFVMLTIAGAPRKLEVDYTPGYSGPGHCEAPSEAYADPKGDVIFGRTPPFAASSASAHVYAWSAPSYGRVEPTAARHGRKLSPPRAWCASPAVALALVPLAWVFGRAARRRAEHAGAASAPLGAGAYREAQRDEDAALQRRALRVEPHVLQDRFAWMFALLALLWTTAPLVPAAAFGMLL